MLLFETTVVAYLTVSGVRLSYLAITSNYSGSLYWLSGLVSVAWGCYGASVAAYYHKSGKENVIKLEQGRTELSKYFDDSEDKPSI